MKVKIAKSWRRTAKNLSEVLAQEFVESGVRFWTEELAHCKWLMKMNAAKYLNQYNTARRLLSIYTMALEHQINRRHWA